MRKKPPYIRLGDLPAAVVPAVGWSTNAPIDSEPRFEKRQLTPAEIKELAGLTQKLLRARFIGTLLSLSLVLLEIIKLSTTGSTPVNIALALIIYAPLCALTLILNVKWTQRAKKLKQDSASGVAIVLRMGTPAPGVTRPLEFLPNSTIIWTENSHPGYWRSHPVT